MTGIRLIVGASSQDYPGWTRTQQDELDLAQHDHWAAQFEPGSIDRVLMEHVWEHLTPCEADTAARMLFTYLRPGGFARCAVPDGRFPGEEYQRIVQVGGPGPADHPAASHRVVYTNETIARSFTAAGFTVRLLEWWDDEGVFHAEQWDETEGFIYRSARFDHRNRDGDLGFTSLIIDAIKPEPREQPAGARS